MEKENIEHPRQESGADKLSGAGEGGCVLGDAEQSRPFGPQRARHSVYARGWGAAGNTALPSQSSLSSVRPTASK